MSITTAGSSSNTLRSAYVSEVTVNTTPATPAFKTQHAPALFDDGVTRFSHNSLVSRGAPTSDAMLNRETKGKIPTTPLIYAVYDPYFESLLQSSWVANAMTDGILTQSVTVENMIAAGVEGTATMKRYTGVEATEATIKVPSEGAITVEFGLLGRQSFDTTTTAITGATYTSPTQDAPFSALSDFTSITFAGLTFDDVSDLEISLGYTGKDPQPKITGDVLVGIARGAPNFRIKGKVYIGPNFAVPYNLARQQTNAAFKVTINMGSTTLEKYRLEFWKGYMQSAMPDYTGANAFLDFEILAAFSATNNGCLTMTRALA